MKLALASIFLFVIIDGFTAWMLWGWFIAPLGVAKINIAHAMGIGLAVRVMAGCNSKSKEEQDTTDAIFEFFGRALFVLGFGWLLHSFIAIAGWGK